MAQGRRLAALTSVFKLLKLAPPSPVSRFYIISSCAPPPKPSRRRCSAAEPRRRRLQLLMKASHHRRRGRTDERRRQAEAGLVGGGQGRTEGHFLSPGVTSWHCVFGYISMTTTWPKQPSKSQSQPDMTSWFVSPPTGKTGSNAPWISSI